MSESENNKNPLKCPCVRKRCPRHGRCGECRAYHEKHRKFRPACHRSGKKGNEYFPLPGKE